MVSEVHNPVCVCVCACACVDNNECAGQSSMCGSRASCLNTPGSFNCECSKGFSLDTTGLECEGEDNTHTHTHTHTIIHLYTHTFIHFYTAELILRTLVKMCFCECG